MKKSFTIILVVCGMCTVVAQAPVVEGVGVLSENGLLEVPPVFSKINNPDYQSGLAYAEMKYNGKIYKGYIETEGEGAGSFRFFVK